METRQNLKKQPSSGYGSNVHAKVVNSSGQTTLISQQISSQYNSKVKLNPQTKIVKKQSSRNQAQQDQEQIQHSARTTKVQLQQTQSQAILNDYSNQLAQQRLATEDADDQRNDSLYNVNGARKQLKKNNTVRQLKSPSPRKMKQHILAVTKQESAVHTNPHVSKPKTSQSKRVKVTVRVDSQVPPVQLQQMMKGSMISSDGEKPAPQTKKLLQHSAKPMSKQLSSSRYRPTGKEIAEAQKVLKQKSALPIQLSDKDSKFQDSIHSPSILQSFGSPRVGLMGNTTTVTSTHYSIGGDSIMNQSNHQLSNGRKLCLSEKIAPKGKKSRKNAQKQPKQISITRDQINIQEQQPPILPQPQMMSYQKYLAPQNFQHQRIEIQLYNPPQHNLKDYLTNQYYHQPPERQSIIQENQDRLTRLERIHNMEMLERMQRIERESKSRKEQHERISMHVIKESIYIDKKPTQHTPIYSNEDIGEETPLVQEFTKESFSKQLTLNNQNDIPPSLFSFHAYPNLSSNKPSAPSDSEDPREVTGIFGAQVDTLGNEQVRQSTEGGMSDKKKITEIPTPVFSAEYTRRNHSFIKSTESMVKTEAQIIENHMESQVTVLNISKVEKELKTLKENYYTPTSKVKKNKRQSQEESKKNTEDSQLAPKELVYDSAKTTILEMDKTMKKVHSTNDLAFRKPHLGSNLNNSSLSSQQSQGSFFSRIRNYFKFGQPQQQMDANSITDELRYEQQYRCHCGPSGKVYACARGIKWLSNLTNYNEREYEKNKELYEGLIDMKAPSGSETQIERDIPRTFPNSDPFMNSYEGQQQLQRVLNAFSKYDTSIGYVQGMNFIVGALLQHCSEDIAFWLFVTLIEDYEMRDIYQPRLPGLYKHSQIIELLQIEHLKDLHEHFCLHNILIEMYASDWIFCLFSNIIPVTHYHFFLDQFFEGGWMFFYKYALTFMKALGPELLEYNDISDILTLIKLKYTKKDSIMPSQPSVENTYLSSDNQSSRQLGNSISPNRNIASNRPSNNSQIQFQVKNMINKLIWKEEKFNSDSFRDDSVWEKLVEASIKDWEEEFNEDFVQNLLQNFDSEKLVFKSSEITTPRNESIAKSPTKSKMIEFREVPKNAIVQLNHGPFMSKEFIQQRERGSSQNHSESANLQLYISDSNGKHRTMHSDIHKVIQMSERQQNVAPKFVSQVSMQSQGKVATKTINLLGSPAAIIEEKGIQNRKHR